MCLKLIVAVLLISLGFTLLNAEKLLPGDDNETIINKLKANADTLKIVTEIAKQEDNSVLQMGFKSNEPGEIYKAVLVFSSLQIPSQNEKKYSIVLIYLFTNIEISKDKSKVIDLINQFHNDYWSGTFSIDEKNRVKGKITVLIPPEGISPNSAFAASMFLMQGWEILFQNLKPYI
ncbi:MAG: hypothetical protein JXA60_10400 [Candidatus Coatesbacteria bacterium]|nr:hypothetical protein [Candidatus Coatesbacteria bacterium]